MADLNEVMLDGKRFQGVVFHCLPETWRTQEEGVRTAARGELLSYLNPFLREASSERRRRVVDREDIQQILPYIA